jgi:hypothetical protein
MVALGNNISLVGQHVLQDMVELQMYLVTQTQDKPWSILPRGVRKSQRCRNPHSNWVESSVGNELVKRGFLEATSNRTFVVSKAGHHFYEEIKP